ncbi:MAG: polysaccharide biosynthesis C-terminal domain-containing protein [Halioglobus sp.]
MGIINLALRSLTLGSRFLLVLFIADRMSLEDLGAYGIITSMVVIALQVIGFDFYVFNAREILGKRSHRVVQFIRDQLSFHGLVYLPAIPLVALLFYYYQSQAGAMLLVLVALVVTEHLSQEASRILVTLRRPLFSNFVLFIRSGSWILGFVALGMTNSGYLTLPVLVLFWLSGSAASVVLAGLVLHRFVREDSHPVQNIDWQWVGQGVRTALPFFLSTVLLQVIELSDRLFIDYYHSKADVGVFVFSQNIANLLNTLVNTGVVVIVAPHLVAAFTNHDTAEYARRWAELKRGVTLGGLVLLLLLFISYPVVIAFLGQEAVAEQLLVFYLLATAVYIGLLAILPYYQLYVRSCDFDLLKSIALAASVNLVLNLLLVPSYGLTGAAVSSIAAYLTMLLVRWRFVRTVCTEPSLHENT